MKKNNNIIVLVFLVVVILIGLMVAFYFVFFKNKKDFNGPSDSSVSEINTSIKIDNGDEKIDWSNYETFDIVLSESIEIKNEGIYNLTGTILNGNIKVNTDGNVKLNLNNISITSLNGPCIYIEQASDVVINISGTNYLTDSDNYSDLDEDVSGAIYSKDDITFDGTGKLVIKANYSDGIVGKDDLKIINGNYEITSVDDGIRGKDSVYILNGDFVINSSSDGIKSTNDNDEEKGFILIKNGNFNIVSGFDGIQAETNLVIDDGIFLLKTGGGSVNASSSNDNWGRWPGYFEEFSEVTNSDSAKGLKAGNNLVINGGSFTLDTSDDAIHSNKYVGISNGTFDINTGDDGIYADAELIIDGGIINIYKSYEGLESIKITINGGEFNITSTDDGINVAGGNDSSSINRPGANQFSTSSSNVLTINSGNIIVNADGDGIDVNGEAYMYDGNVTVYGPTNSGNGALDYDSVFEVNGGTIIASGASGMAQSFSNSSKIYQVYIGFSSTITSNDIVTILDDNNEIIKFQSAKTYSSLVIASPQFIKGSTYAIKINNEQYETFTISSNETLVGSNQSMFPGMGGNRPQGGHNGRR